MSLSSDGSADPRICCRICHICSAHNWHTLCSACGHTLCERCPCETSETIEATDTSLSDNYKKAPIPRKTNVKNQPGQRFDAEHHHSATTESKRPRGIQGDDKHKGSSTSHREDYPWKPTQKGIRRHDLTEQKSTPSFQHHSLRPQRSVQAVSENPFLIADREAKGRTSAFSAADNNLDTASRGAGQHSGIDHRNRQVYTEPLCPATPTGHYSYHHGLLRASRESSRSQEYSTHTPSPIVTTAVTRSYESHPRQVYLPAPADRFDHATLQKHHGDTGRDITGHLTTTHPPQRIQDGKPLRYPQHDQTEISKHADTSAQTKGRKLARNTDLEEDKYHLWSRQNNQRVEPSLVPKDFKGQHVDRHDHPKYDIDTADSSKAHYFTHTSTHGSSHAQKRSGSRRSTPVKQPTTDRSSHREPTPPGRVFSPPSWLAHPSKQAGDAFSRLRHIETKSHGDFLHTGVKHVEERGTKRPKTANHSTGLLRNLYSRVSGHSYGIDRPSVPSPPTALHVTHHQRPELWMGSQASVHSASRASHQHQQPQPEINWLSSSPPVLTTTMARAQHLQAQRDASNKHLMPPTSTLSRKSMESLRQESRSKQEQEQEQERHKQTSTRTRAHQHSPLPTSERSVSREASPWKGRESKASGTSPAPLPLPYHHPHSHPPHHHDLLEYSTSAAPLTDHYHYHYHHGSHDSNQSQEQRQRQRTPVTAIDKASDLELHHPDPILPPNHHHDHHHYCSWRDRYLALASETRLLKAEVSARAEVMGEEVPQFACASARGGEEGRSSGADTTATTAAVAAMARKSGEEVHRRQQQQQQQQEVEEGVDGYDSGDGDGDDGSSLGLEGVTIVMHMRDKDDLVIDTDLTQTQTQTHEGR